LCLPHDKTWISNIICSVPPFLGSVSWDERWLLTDVLRSNPAQTQWLATGRWFSPITQVFSTNKTDCHDIAEILLKVALNTITPFIMCFVEYKVDHDGSSSDKCYTIFHIMLHNISYYYIIMFQHPIQNKTDIHWL
jgi:hypothetical protein